MERLALTYSSCQKNDCMTRAALKERNVYNLRIHPEVIDIPIGLSPNGALLHV